jgi:hypothetical protein
MSALLRFGMPDAQIKFYAPQQVITETVGLSQGNLVLLIQ